MQIRHPVVAGRFYTNNPEELRAEVAGYLARAEEYRAGHADLPVLGCMVPHAGYMFSGLVAGLTLGQIKIPHTVMILAPSHSGLGPALALWPDGAWRTPLGDVPVDAAGTDRLARGFEKIPGSDYLFQTNAQAHLRDHAIEVVLPFLQVARPDVQIIALCVREYDSKILLKAGEAIAGLLNERKAAHEEILLVTSSDMSHYVPHDEGKKLDRLALDRINALDAGGLLQVCATRKISMCGCAPMGLMLYALNALGAGSARITAHTSSGITGKAYGAGLDSVVGYAGVIAT